MLRNTDTSPGSCDNDALAGRGRSGDVSLLALIEQLQRLGFEVPPLYGRQNNVAGGVAMQLSVRKWLQSGTGPGGVNDAIRTLLGDRTPFTLSLSDLGSGDAALDALQRLCAFLRMEITNNGYSGKYVGICVHSGELPLQAFQVIADSAPGDGGRYVLLDGLQMTQSGKRQLVCEMDKSWSFLWRNRMAPLMPAYSTTVRTACPLLADEAATSVLPVYGIQVPVDSAWLPVSLALPQFADDAGEIGWEQLLRTLASGVELADKVLDRLHWLRAAQQSDARLNRRLAISISGLGDLVVHRGLDPRDLHALRWLSAIVMRIRRKLWHCSARLARNEGCLPVLCGSDPSSGWDDSVYRDSWRHRWRAALEKAAVRHRNMLVMSPYAVLPSAEFCDAAYTDLLPVIACADAWSFAGASHARDWNLSEYETFHRRAWAVIQGCGTRTLVAGGV